MKKTNAEYKIQEYPFFLHYISLTYMYSLIFKLRYLRTFLI